MGNSIKADHLKRKRQDVFLSPEELEKYFGKLRGCYVEKNNTRGRC